MQSVRHGIVIALVVVQLIISFIFLGTSLFADAGEIWWRAAFVVHPLTAILLLVLVLTPSRSVAMAATALIALNIVADVATAASIASGAIKGDWWLPLIFSIVPLVVLPHAIGASKAHPAAPA